jgi:uncharacterized membrane-anchored protein
MGSCGPDDGQRSFRPFLSKVPEVTVFFWALKIAATAVGYGLSGSFGLVVTTMLTTTVVSVLMAVQLLGDRYVPWLYGSIVVSMGIVGPLIADNLIDVFGASPKDTAVASAALFVGTLGVWYATERTLSIRTIDTARREAFYWLAILCTFVLAAAIMRDSGGDSPGFGYRAAGIVSAAVIAVLWAAHRFLGLGTAFAFWCAYVFSGPLGIAVGEAVDRLIGPLAANAVLLVMIVLVVSYLTISHRDEPSLDAEPSLGAGPSFGAARKARRRPPR